MNLPNKLTLLRVLLVPIFVYLMLIAGDNLIFQLSAELVFIIACLTDLLDGKLARKYNMITNFGKLMDPLADKLLVCAALICFVELSKVPSYVVIIIISREFIISGFRLIAAEQNIIIAANYWGKFKTTFQMLMIVVMIIDIKNIYWNYLGQGLMYIALILTVISLVDYVYKNRQVITKGGI